ncbi:MAG: hypothetical protein KAS95_04115 [Candidatus Heimdallarchaeota archaeon]|nr:hypothetical protein [Candidatus Heimdallarchaeota archaeon]
MPNTFYIDYIPNKDLQAEVQRLGYKGNDKTKQDAQQIVTKAINSNKFSQVKIRSLWNTAMKNMFFNNYIRMFIYIPTQRVDTSKKIKASLQREAKTVIDELELTEPQFYTSTITKKPKHFLVALTFEKVDNFSSFLKVPLEKQLILTFLPELGVATYWPIDKDQKLKFIMKLLLSTFQKTSEIKVNALLLRKYSTQEPINKLTISTPQEIAGFPGLDVIEFKGEDVVLGLSGLKRRHDANVDVITRVGPFTEIESQSITLTCGKGVKLKNYNGLESLLKVIKT